jgi:hypothetical protein
MASLLDELQTVLRENGNKDPSTALQAVREFLAEKRALEEPAPEPEPEPEPEPVPEPEPPEEP